MSGISLKIEFSVVNINRSLYTQWKFNYFYIYDEEIGNEKIRNYEISNEEIRNEEIRNEEIRN